MSQDLPASSIDAQPEKTDLTIPPSPEKTWFKKDGAWYWKWDFGETQVSLINAESTRQVLVVIRNELSKESRAVSIIPKSVIEDMYKDLVLAETEVVNAALSAELARVREQLAEMTSRHDQCEVVMSEDSDDRA